MGWWWCGEGVRWYGEENDNDAEKVKGDLSFCQASKSSASEMTKLSPRNNSHRLRLRQSRNNPRLLHAITDLVE